MGYRSVEQIVGEAVTDFVEPVTDPIKTFIPAAARAAFNFTEYFSRAAYATTASLFRIPTLNRKMRSRGQIWIERLPEEHRNGKRDITLDRFVGSTSGMIFSLGGAVYGLYECVEEAGKGNYLPAIITAGTLALTNLLSAAYELGRANRVGEFTTQQ